MTRMQPRRVRPDEFAARLSISRRTLYNMVAKGLIDRPTRMTPRTASWGGDYVDAIINGGNTKNSAHAGN